MDIKIIYRRIEEIDNELKSNGFLITQRHFHASIEYQKKFNISFSSDSDTAQLINNWYKTVYGDNLKINVNKKNYLIKIKGDIFVLGVPLFFGSMQFYWGQGDIVKPPEGMSSKQISVDARNFIDYITPTYSHLISENDIVNSMKWMHKTIEIDTYFKDKISEKIDEMYKIIYGDLISAKEHFMINSYDMTAWQCLQVAEKLLKMYIKKYKNQEPERIHILQKLNEMAEITDPGIVSLIPLLEASPSTRYEVKITREEAFKRYEATINFIDFFIKIF